MGMKYYVLGYYTMPFWQKQAPPTGGSGESVRFLGVSALMIHTGLMLIIGGARNLHMIHRISKAVKENSRFNMIDAAWKPLA